MPDPIAPTGFDALIADLGEFAKGATASDDEKIAAAAAEGAAAGAAEGDKPAGEGEGDDKDGKGEDKDGKPFGKSLSVTLENGEKVDAIDATEMLKSLEDRIQLGETKTVDAITALVGIVRGQSDMLKSLGEQVATLGAQGTGRKAVLAITPTPGAVAADLAKSEAGSTITAEAFMAKALDAQKDGRIMASDVSLAETYLNRGQAVPEALQRAVLNI